MLNQVFGPLLLIPRVLSSDEDIFDKLLALPPIIIQTSGGTFKPFLMVVEPFLRWFKFLITGEYKKSLSSGLDLAAAYGINIWGGAFKPKKLNDDSEKEPQKKGSKSLSLEIELSLNDNFILI